MSVLTELQINSLNQDGFLILPDLFNELEIEQLKSGLPDLLSEQNEANIVEKASG
ncbi:MAG: hypothetical protein ACI8XC_002920, partial [Gammaproteobacteria bacterium]